MNDRTHPLDIDATDDAARRREFLEKLGKIAAYTPPTLLALMLSRRASANSNNAGGGGHGKGGGGGGGGHGCNNPGNPYNNGNGYGGNPNC